MADLSWVTARLAVGGKIESFTDARMIKHAGVTHVLNLRENNEDEKPWCKRLGLEYLHNGESNDLDAKPTSWFQRSIDFAWKAFAGAPSAKLLIHCKAGEHRSPSTAYAVLRSFGISAGDASDLVTDAREATDGQIALQDNADAAIRRLGYE